MTKKDNENPNIDRNEQRKKAATSEELKKKYGAGSHTENVNTTADSDAYHDQKTAKDKDLKTAEAPLLDRQKKNEQHVELKNKSHLDEKEG